MNNTIKELEVIDMPLVTRAKAGNAFGLMTTISAKKDSHLPKLKVDYKKKTNPFSTPDTNILAQVSQVSCGKTIWDFV